MISVSAISDGTPACSLRVALVVGNDAYDSLPKLQKAVNDARAVSAELRRLGFEWLHLLLAQPRKFRRYVFGNPLFLLRLVREKLFGAPA